MIKIVSTVGTLALAVSLTWSTAPLAQSGPAEAIVARCKAEHFQDADRARCETKQRAAMAEFMPVVKFIAEGKYVAQMLALSSCSKATQDYYGQNYLEMSVCYERKVTASCGTNKACLANSTIAGIHSHIRNETQP